MTRAQTETLYYILQKEFYRAKGDALRLATKTGNPQPEMFSLARAITTALNAIRRAEREGKIKLRFPVQKEINS